MFVAVGSYALLVLPILNTVNADIKSRQRALLLFPPQAVMKYKEIETAVKELVVTLNQD